MMTRTLGVLLAASMTWTATAQVETSTPLIPRDVLFGNPERASVRLSPDGQWLSYLAPRDGVMNIWVAPADNPDKARAITADDNRGIRQYFWAQNSGTVVYLQDTGGDENWRAYAVDIDSAEVIDLTPFEGVQAQIQGVSPEFPDHILIGLNNRMPQLHDVYKVDVTTGDRELVLENTGYVGYTFDQHFTPRFAQRFRVDGGLDIFTVNDDLSINAEPWDMIPADDALSTNMIAFDKTGDVVYMLDSRRGDTTALYTVDVNTKVGRKLYEHSKADVSGAMVNPITYEVEAASANYLRNEWTTLNPDISRDFEAIRRFADGEFSVSSRTADDSAWIVVDVQDDGPVRYYRYDRENKQGELLFTNRPDLDDLDLSPMHPVVIPTRDGLEMVCYLSLPVWSDTDGDARPDEPLPMVLNVHGGPWARDSWGYDPTHQWLANRGYAVLSVNYRGSTGFGKKFLNAANFEWGYKMHDDLIDAVDWAVGEGIAADERVAIFGGSYGGYAALAGVTFTPEKFAAAVDIVGPSNLITLMESIPPYWKPLMSVFQTRVGDHTTPEGRRKLRDRSPLTHVDEINKPLLIAQGANDPRVKQAESDQIVDAMQEKGIPVAYVLFPDEGHGFAKPENRQAFFAVTEAFLAEHIGGRYDPIDDDLDGSSITVPVGAEEVPGLSGLIDN